MLSLAVELGRCEFYYYFKHPFSPNLPKSSVKVMHVGFEKKIPFVGFIHARVQLMSAILG